ncbi:transposase [Paraburkholderia caribensis]|uniref:Transposase n=1 Tax=Paraburkholderia caribensis TaxID=75105 RepID=A0ABV0DQS6_9BURK|nr:transposase [Paraburkholderia caribensis]MCO4876582.1 transposase [Paraburkholderia caribensis]
MRRNKIASAATTLRTRLMTDRQTDFDFLPLRVIGKSADGKNRYDRDGKRKLIEACQKPGASVAGLALKAGVNANQLRKWIGLERKKTRSRTERQPTPASAPAFVPVLEVVDAEPVHLNLGTRLRWDAAKLTFSQKLALFPVEIFPAGGEMVAAIKLTVVSKLKAWPPRLRLPVIEPLSVLRDPGIHKEVPNEINRYGDRRGVGACAASRRTLSDGCDNHACASTR